MSAYPTYPCFLHTSFGEDFRSPRVDMGMDDVLVASLRNSIPSDMPSKWTVRPVTAKSFILMHAPDTGNSLQLGTKSRLDNLPNKIQFSGDKAQRAGLKKMNEQAWAYRLPTPSGHPVCWLVFVY